jgi:NAD+--asparagine ADP-ribosyltransferase
MEKAMDTAKNFNKTIPDISSKTWQEYHKNHETVHNERLRPDNVSFWDAMLSKEADFTKTPEGKHIADLIRDL